MLIPLQPGSPFAGACAGHLLGLQQAQCPFPLHCPLSGANCSPVEGLHCLPAEGPIEHIAVSPDGSLLAVSSQEHLSLWDTRQLRSLRHMPLPWKGSGHPMQLSFLGSSGRLAVCSPVGRFDSAPGAGAEQETPEGEQQWTGHLAVWSVLQVSSVIAQATAAVKLLRTDWEGL